MASEEARRSNELIVEEYCNQIQELREVLTTQVELPDEFLLRCLFSRNLDVLEAMKLVHNALRLHKDYDIMLDLKGVNMDALGVSLSNVSGVRTLQGHRVVFHDISKWDPYKVNYYDANYCLTLLQGAVGWNDLTACRDGMVVVTDATVVNFHHIKNVTLNNKSSGIAANALTNYMPYNNRYNLVINASYGADILWKGASLVMPKTMVETMNLIRRGDTQSLSKYFSAEVIRKELYRPTQTDLEWTRLVVPKYAKYRNSLYRDVIAVDKDDWNKTNMKSFNESSDINFVMTK